MCEPVMRDIEDCLVHEELQCVHPADASMRIAFTLRPSYTGYWVGDAHVDMAGQGLTCASIYNLWATP